MKELVPDKVQYIVIHITDSYYGDVQTINEWHLENGWAGIGYHRLITNCYPTYETWKEKIPQLDSDGEVHQGRPLQFQGAHAKGWNNKSVGVGLVGKDGQLSARQLQAAGDVCAQLLVYFPNIEKVIGHYETGSPKDCPCLNMNYFRELIEGME